LSAAITWVSGENELKGIYRSEDHGIHTVVSGENELKVVLLLRMMDNKKRLYQARMS